jgi:hypothetical protein
MFLAWELAVLFEAQKACCGTEARPNVTNGSFLGLKARSIRPECPKASKQPQAVGSVCCFRSNLLFILENTGRSATEVGLDARD